MRSTLLPLALALFVAGCDSGTDGLVLDGSYSGDAQVEITLGADPLFAELGFTATFDGQAPGTITSTVRLDEEVASLGTPTETFTGTLTGTLGENGAISLSGTLAGDDGQRTINATGTATSSRIELDVAGTFEVDGLVLTR